MKFTGFLDCILNIDITPENNVHRNVNEHLNFKIKLIK